MRSLGHFWFINLYHGFMSYILLLPHHKSISSSLLAFMNSVPLSHPGEEVQLESNDSPCLSEPPTAREHTASVCYGWGAFWKKRSKESLEDEPGCAHKRRAGLLPIQYVPVWREVVRVFIFRVRAFL